MKQLLKAITEIKEKEDEKRTIFTKPTEKLIYTSYFGMRDDPFGSSKREFHTGIDITGGGNIFSVLKGKVIRKVYSNQGYGNYVDVDHSDINGKRLITRYAHLSTIHVKLGQEVEKGQKLGVMGTTGRSTGIHLHFEVIENGRRKDPLPYIQKGVEYEKKLH